MSRTADIFSQLGLDALNDPLPGASDGAFFETSGEVLESIDPTTGEVLGRVRQATPEDYERVAASSVAAFAEWRALPAPQRGEIVRQLGDELRKYKEPLGQLVTLEMGKI
ncbi:MAG: aldehyde dehydrogenase family protein, partial [Acidobacteriota bacterium]